MITGSLIRYAPSTEYSTGGGDISLTPFTSVPGTARLDLMSFGVA